MPDAVTPASSGNYKSLPGGKKSKSDQLVEITSVTPRETSRSKSPVKLGPSLSRNTSPSSSEYSCDSDNAASSGNRGKTSKHTRRSSTLSDVGSDRRRLAIVQMETVHEGRSKSASDAGHNPRLRRARPNLTGIAIVAPPDASPSTYTHLSPPLSSTVVNHAESTQRTRFKQRTQTVKTQRPSSQPQVTGDKDNGEPSNNRSISSVKLQSFANASSSSVDLHNPAVDPYLTTPPIGHSKDIHIPVAGPVVVNLDPSRPLNISKVRTKTNIDPPPAITAQSSTDSSGKRGEVPFIHYQPGLHSTAGPLPPPPRATFAIDPSNPPPPRPPRTPHPPRSSSDIEAVKQALQLPPSVSAALASRSHALSSELSSPQSTVESPTHTEEAVETKPLHRREGAFVPTPELASDQMSSSLLQQGLDQKNTSAESITMNETAQLPSVEEHDKTSIGSNIIVVEPPPRSDSLHTTDEYVIPSHPRPDPTSFTDVPSQKPSPPPKSFRNSLTMSLKRFSPLPRPPSGSPRSGNRSSVGTIRTSRTPSPSYPIQHETIIQPPRHKVITQNPPGLYCHEVHLSKSGSERCSIYAQKINELYNCDTGLVLWLHEAKYRGTNNLTSVPNNASPFAPQRRHTSGSSIMTQVTFPLRPDATTATDLTNTNRNITPPSVQPPPLPYPSLAISQQQRPPPSTPTSSIRSFANSTPTNTLKGALFASLGRRTSVATSWREKPGITALSPSNSQNGGGSNSSGRVNMFMKQPPQNPNPRPVNVTTSPSVPGGPRALPNRVKRSQTLMATLAPFSTKPETERAERQSTHHIIPDRVDIKPDPEFTRQVDKLADLLPHADRDVLTAYLRRAGQDILAIGQYLDDEKNGTIRAD